MCQNRKKYWAFSNMSTLLALKERKQRELQSRDFFSQIHLTLILEVCFKIALNMGNTNLSHGFWVGCDFPGVLLGVLDVNLPCCFPGVLWGVCVVLAVGVFGVFPGVLADFGLHGDRGPPINTIYIQYHHWS